MNKDDMEKMMREMASISGMPKVIRLEVWYDKKLQEITGREFDPVMMSEGSTFIYLLQNIFMEHPEIEKKYPAGTLGLTIDGVPPKTYTLLFDGDKVLITADR